MTDTHPRHAEYEDFGIEQSLKPYPEQPVHQFFTDAADFHPEQGIVQHDQHFSYEQLQNDVTALAAALQEREIGPGDRVATVLPTAVQFFIVTHAISLAGGVHVPDDFLDAAEDPICRLEQSDPDVLIGHDEHLELLERLREEADVAHLIVTSLADYGGDPADPTAEAERRGRMAARSRRGRGRVHDLLTDEGERRLREQFRLASERNWRCGIIGEQGALRRVSTVGCCEHNCLSLVRTPLR